jgi:hypothetical protein
MVTNITRIQSAPNPYTCIYIYIYIYIYACDACNGTFPIPWFEHLKTTRLIAMT